MNVERMDVADSQCANPPRPEPQEEIPSPHEVLEELFHLLEDYAPAWYTEKHHNRAVAALIGQADIQVEAGASGSRRESSHRS